MHIATTNESPIFLCSKSDPAPILVFCENDNYINKHINDVELDLFKELGELKSKPLIHVDNKSKIKIKITFSDSVILKCDRAPLNHIAGAKGGSHQMRYYFNQQQEKYVDYIPIQHSDFYFRLDEAWTLFDDQKEREKEMKDNGRSITSYVLIYNLLKHNLNIYKT